MTRPDRALRQPLLIPLALTAAVVLAADQLTKTLVRGALQLGEELWIIDGWIGLERSSNSGVAFSLLDGNAALPALIIAAAIGIAWLGVAFLQGDASPWTSIGVGAIAAGALGNLIDRTRDGAVTDFVAVGPWPRFNVADAALTCGIGLLIYRSLTTGEHEHE